MKIKLFVIAFGAALAMATAAPALAQGTVGAFFSGFEPRAVGPGISGAIYGNTSNPSGNGNGVLPSFAPGPWVCESTADCSGPTDPGGSMGDFLAPLASGGAASPEFANGNDPDIDFSAH